MIDDTFDNWYLIYLDLSCTHWMLVYNMYELIKIIAKCNIEYSLLFKKFYILTRKISPLSPLGIRKYNPINIVLQKKSTYHVLVSLTVTIF